MASLTRQQSLGLAGKQLLGSSMGGGGGGGGNPLGSKGPDVVLTAASVRVGLEWDFFPGQPKVDLDCAALVFDKGGS